MSYPLISGDPTQTNDILPNAKLGGLYRTEHDIVLNSTTLRGTKVWRYVKVVGTSGDLALGDCTVAASVSSTWDGFSVTRVAASALVGTPLGSVVPCTGVAQGTITTGQYGYVMYDGDGVVKGDGSVAVGNSVVVDGGTSPARNADTAADGEQHAVFGFALEDDSGGSNFFACKISCKP